MKKVKSAQIVTMSGKSYLYVVTEDGGIYYCEHNPKENKANWTRMITPSK